MWRRLIWGVLLLGLAGCGSAPVVEPTSKDALRLSPLQWRGAGLVVGPLRRDSVWEEVKLVGRTVVLAHAQARVHARVEGTIEHIAIREGQYVSAGQPLFVLYSAQLIDLQRQYLEVWARLQAAARRLNVQESLARGGLVSAAELAQVRAEQRQLEVQWQALQRQLELLGIRPDTSGEIRLLIVRAPIAGYVTRIAVGMGEYVRPEQPLAHIVNPSDLHADLYISERELSWLAPGMPIRLRLPALPEMGFLSSRIEYLAQVEDTQGTALVAHVRLPPTPYPLFAQIPAEGYVRRLRGLFYAVPLAGLGYRGDKPYIFALKPDSTFWPIPVQATFLDTLALIEAPELREGLPIVQRGASFLAAQLWQIGEE
ncbi:MAG: efflux RND transporter periplasmic adaptor subunit [Bacteroidia bacterium]|nr:efflux RND transporter periplasmic adaptor subunit [Bacteroidia bacterium]MDW8088514.1 efflux RND transporter periplasmic adaptor subunit [Bacteroidia bacterium]